MAQLHFFNTAWVAAAAILFVSSCSPTPQPFDRQAAPPKRPSAHVSGLPYPPQAPNSTSHENIAQAPQSTLPSKRVKVGLLLPLSGDASHIGNALRDAAVMALFDKYATLGHEPSIRVELVTKDTRGTPEGAKQAAAEAVREGATLLLGPLFSRSVEAIKPLAATGKVTVISFSNNKDVAGNGVYIYGFNPTEQAERIANYAYRRGINNVAALTPNDAYGRQVLKGFERIGELMGRKIQPVVRYASAGAELHNNVRSLVAQGTDGARFTFNALFLPEGGQKLAPILSALSDMNVTPQTVQFLGTGLWDSPELIRNYNLNGAWIASAPPRFYEGFVSRFTHSYGYEPPRLASLSYDAVALAATMVMTPQGFSRQALTHASGYSGPANGIFRFLPNGTSERKLAILQVDGNRGFIELDPAPTSFK